MEDRPNNDDSPKSGEKEPTTASTSASGQNAKQGIYLQDPSNFKEEITLVLRVANPEDREYRVKQPIKVELAKDEEITKFERNTLRLGYWGFSVALLSLFAAGVGAWVFFGQFKEMATQTELLRQSVQDARRDSAKASHTTAIQLKLAQQQADAATASVNQARTESAANTKRVEKQLRLLRQQVAASDKQAAAALSSAVAIQQQTEISERPWLSVEVAPAGNLMWVHGQAVLTLKFTIRNIGKSIAKGTQIDVTLYPSQAGFPVAPDAAALQRRLCSNPKPQNLGRFDVFPTSSAIIRQLTVETTKAAIDAIEIPSAVDIHHEFVSLFFVGCVTYGSSFENDSHQTLFAYQLIGPGASQPNTPPPTLENGIPVMGDFEVGVRVPKKEIGLMQELLAVNAAN